MLGNTILCNANGKGRFLEGTIQNPNNVPLLPGIKVQIMAQPFLGGRPQFMPYAPGTNFDQPGASNDPAATLILLDDPYQGFTPLIPYVVGTRCFVYAPLPGDEMNILTVAEAGTGSSNELYIGNRLGPINLTGQYYAVALTATADFVVMEHIFTTVDTPTLVYCQRQ